MCKCLWIPSLCMAAGYALLGWRRKRKISLHQFNSHIYLPLRFQLSCTSPLRHFYKCPHFCLSCLRSSHLVHMPGATSPMVWNPCRLKKFKWFPRRWEMFPRNRNRGRRIRVGSFQSLKNHDSFPHHLLFNWKHNRNQGNWNITRKSYHLSFH